MCTQSRERAKNISTSNISFQGTLFSSPSKLQLDIKVHKGRRSLHINITSPASSSFYIKFGQSLSSSSSSSILCQKSPHCKPFLCPFPLRKFDSYQPSPNPLKQHSCLDIHPLPYESDSLNLSQRYALLWIHYVTPIYNQHIYDLSNTQFHPN